MKKLNLFIAAISLSIGLTAQTYSEGDNLLNVGFGLGATFATGSSTIPPLSVSFEHGFTDNISAGGLIGYSGSKDEVPTFGGTWTFKYSYIIIGARGSYHFYSTDKIDAYGGALLGYNIGSSSVEFEGAGNNFVEPAAADVGGVAYGLHVGGRYYFNESIGAFGELGYGISYLTLGLTMKLYE